MGRKKAKHARNEDSPQYYDEHLDGVRLPVSEVADVEFVEAGQLSESEATAQEDLDKYLAGDTPIWTEGSSAQYAEYAASVVSKLQQIAKDYQGLGLTPDQIRAEVAEDIQDGRLQGVPLWEAELLIAGMSLPGVDELMEVPVSTATSPSYYEYPGGVQMRDITRWHTSNGGQAMQYVGRATRFDLKSKYQSEEGRIEDLDKAINFLEDEKKRLKGEF